MHKKNTPDNKATNGKKSSSSKIIKIAAGAAIMVSVFSTDIGYSQNSTYPVNTQKKDIIEVLQKNDKVINVNDSIEHQKIITMNADSIITKYGEKKGLEIINQHILIEINKIRQTFNDSLSPEQKEYLTLKNLTLQPKLCTAAQLYAEYMYKNNRYEHTGKDGVTAESRIGATGYPFNFLGENIFRTSDIPTIKNVITAREYSGGHHRTIVKKKFLHAGIGYYKSYRVLDLGGQR
ncbi:MAG: CAP domain-containing protein [Candidatus Absconditabacterales bacterium]